MGRQLATVVDGLLEPLVEDRLTAGEALDMLTSESEQSQSPSTTTDRWVGVVIAQLWRSCQTVL